MLLNALEDNTILMKKHKFLQTFDALDEYSGTIKSAVGVFDDECQLVGIYYSRRSYAHLVNEFEELRKEIKKLKMERKQLVMKRGIVNLKTLAEVLGCSNGHIYTLIEQGMPYHQLDPKSRRYFVVDEVVNWLKTAGFKQVTTWKAR